jgi:hypothetical protein
MFVAKKEEICVSKEPLGKIQTFQIIQKKKTLYLIPLIELGDEGK